MPIATPPPSKTDLPTDATPTAVATHEEIARGTKSKQSEPQPADTADDPYDNVACTD